jgi:hypothetical protein
MRQEDAEARLEALKQELVARTSRVAGVARPRDVPAGDDSAHCWRGPGSRGASRDKPGGGSGERVVIDSIPYQSATRSLRLTFRHAEGEVTLQAMKRVDMIAPGGLMTRLEGAHTGSWVEIRDPTHALLYQRVLFLPIGAWVEVPGAENGRMELVPMDHPSGAFDVIVPDLPDADVVVLLASPYDQPHRPATELVRVRVSRAEGEDGQ